MHGFREGTFRVTLLTTLTASLALPSLARADFYLHYWEDQYEAPEVLRLNADVGYYVTKDDFDGSGKLIIPTGFLQYSRIQTDLTAAYGLTSKLSAFGRLSWARTEVDQTSQIVTGFGFTDNSAGLTLRAVDNSGAGHPDAFSLDLQAQVDFPLYASGGTTGTTLGDGSVDVTGGAFANLPLTHWSASSLGLRGGAGFTYRTGGFSPAVPWSLAVMLKPRTDGFSLAFRALGLMSMGGDARETAVVPGSTTLSAQSGGSFITNAVNPSLISVRGELGYQFGNELAVTAFVSQSVWGLAAPNGLYAGAGLTAHLGKRAKGTLSAMSPQDYGRSNQGFINYSLDAHVTRVNDRLNLVKIDKGSQDSVATGQTFDIFVVKKDGNVGAAIARGHVSAVQLNESAITVDEYFKEIWIDEGFLAKRPVQ